MKNNTQPFDTEELEILGAIEKDELISVPFSKKDHEALRIVARNTLAKTRTINIRVSERDLLHIKARAIAEGIPYQTLITSVLHRYVETA